MCQRYFAKSFPYATAPAQNAGLTGALGAQGGNGGKFIIPLMFPVAMRSASPSVDTYNPSASASSARNVDDNSNRAVTVGDECEFGCVIETSGTVTADNNDRFRVHYTAADEL